MSHPIAVLISDIHFTVSTLDLASKALKAAMEKAGNLGVPLVIAGDLHDSKAIIRAEVANTLIKLLKQHKTPVYILVGNHDLINEKSTDHGLNYLKPYARLIESPEVITISPLHPVLMVPYQTDQTKFISLMKSGQAIEVICHQGFLGAYMGDYIQDKTSIDPNIVKDLKVVSGHYHRHQSLGSVTYIGNPYTMSFGEANDGPKGFIVLNSDWTITREILDLRKHIKIQRSFDDLMTPPSINKNDLLWLQVSGPSEELKKLNKAQIGDTFIGHSSFKLDLIATDVPKQALTTPSMSDYDIFKALMSARFTHNEYLLELYNEIIDR